MNEPTDTNRFRFGIRSLMLTTLNISLFLGATMWAIRASDAGVEQYFDSLAEVVEGRDNIAMLLGIAAIMPMAFIAALVAFPLTMLRIGRCSYSVFHLLGFAVIATVAVLWWFIDFHATASPGIVARLAVPLGISALALPAELGYRKSPAPYWVLAGVGLLMAFAYPAFIVAVWACGGKV